MSENRKKIMIVGSPGSGKSTFARALYRLTGIPLCHLDLLYWNSDKTIVPREEFRLRLEKVLAEESWIVDGNYASTMEFRLQRCDTVFFLDYTTEVCLEGITARLGKPRPDIPWTSGEEDPELFQFVKDFPTQSRPGILDLLGRYPEKEVIIFRERAEAERFLQKQREDA